MQHRTSSSPMIHHTQRPYSDTQRLPALGTGQHGGSRLNDSEKRSLWRCDTQRSEKATQRTCDRLN